MEVIAEARQLPAIVACLWLIFLQMLHTTCMKRDYWPRRHFQFSSRKSIMGGMIRLKAAEQTLPSQFHYHRILFEWEGRCWLLFDREFWPRSLETFSYRILYFSMNYYYVQCTLPTLLSFHFLPTLVQFNAPVAQDKGREKLCPATPKRKGSWCCGFLLLAASSVWNPLEPFQPAPPPD